MFFDLIQFFINESYKIMSKWVGFLVEEHVKYTIVISENDVFLFFFRSESEDFLNFGKHDVIEQLIKSKIYKF